MRKIIIHSKSHGFNSVNDLKAVYQKNVGEKTLRKLEDYKPQSAKRKSIIRSLKRDFADILLGDPFVLASIIVRYKRNGTVKYLAKNKLFHQKIAKIFDYHALRENKTEGGWLASVLGIKACLYCNSQFMLVLRKSGKPAFTFDHFFPQKKYPFLGISFFNLIPCCSHCNQVKSGEDFSLNDLVHPYLESFDSIAKFGTDKKSIIEFINDRYSDTNKIQLKFKFKGKSSDIVSQSKFAKHLEIFDLMDVYENHKDPIGDIYVKAKIYNTAFRNYLKSLGTGPNQFLNDEYINRAVVGNYVTSKDVNKRPLAKLYKDISKEAGLI